MRAAYRILAVAVSLGAAWCAGAGAGEVLLPPERPPALLSGTGLYADTAAHAVDPANRLYIPQYPLWTDGAAKSRWIRLPEGAAIDDSEIGAWRFPAGTKLWKEFSFGGRRVETRLIWKLREGSWIFATYVWNEEQTDAALAPESGIPGLAEVAPGKRHSIPSLDDCAACHGAGRSPVLGFSALQLSDDRDPLAPHGEPLLPGALTLRSLLAEGRLDPPRPELADNPPRIPASSPRERAALGYLSSNCGVCHNASGPLSRLGLVLAHDPASASGTIPEALATAVDAPGRFKIPGIAAGDSRLLAPGDPARSAILYRMRSRRPSSQMPPLGSVLPDDEALELIENWVAQELPAARIARTRPAH